MLAKEIKRPEGPEQIEALALKQMKSQGVHAGCQLRRIWEAYRGPVDLETLTSGLALMAETNQETVHKIVDGHQLNKVSTLVKLARGMARSVRLVARRMQDAEGRHACSIEIRNVIYVRDGLARLLQQMWGGDASREQVAALTGLDEQSLERARKGRVRPDFETLFRLTTANGYLLQVFIVE